MIGLYGVAKCLNCIDPSWGGTCLSPVACTAFGYCRSWNLQPQHDEHMKAREGFMAFKAILKGEL